jgi:hypothetical protein
MIKYDPTLVRSMLQAKNANPSMCLKVNVTALGSGGVANAALVQRKLVTAMWPRLLRRVAKSVTSRLAKYPLGRFARTGVSVGRRG